MTMTGWKNEVFRNFRLYAVTDIKAGDVSFFKKVEAAYAGGADIVQLRSKALSDGELVACGRRIREIADRCRKLYFVNDRLDIALATSADGLHIGQDDMPVADVSALMRRAGAEMFLGKSTHSYEQALRTAAEEVDYIGVGPVFSTPTKPAYEPVGMSLVREVSRAISRPFVAIGGIDASNLSSVYSCGARRFAVVRAIFDAEDVYAATKKLCEQIDACRENTAVA